MASTTALFTGLSALNANARALDVIGNNIANANTTAFKSSRILFANQYSRTISSGSGPSVFNGGGNPTQIGLGVSIAGTQRDFTAGSVSTTGDQRDLAIDGSGFFVVKKGGAQYYTRAGAFRQNALQDLIDVSGNVLQGYGVDANFNIQATVLRDLNIPTGTLTLVQATRNAVMGGNLNAAGPLPTMGSSSTLPALSLIGGGSATTGSLMTDVEDPNNSGQPIVAVGQILEVEGVAKGTSIVPTARLTVTSTTTVQDFMTFIQESLGIAVLGPNPDGLTPGVSIDGAGQITINGNVGSVNNLNIGPAGIHIVDTTGVELSRPFPATLNQGADGESVRTQYIVYDSLGTPITMNMSFSLISKNNGAGTTWRYFAESGDDTLGGYLVGTGTVDFDQNGNLLSPNTLTLAVDRASSGADSPLTFVVDLVDPSAKMTAFQSEVSGIASPYQDGAPIGVLQTYSVGTDGVITGSFSNGLIRTLGQVALAMFSNPEGLVDIGGNLFQPGANSGTPIIGQPRTPGAGQILGGALELSNVDLSEEFINLITASTGFSAASRIITTTDQLIQQLLNIGR